MKIVWAIGQMLYLILAIASAVQKNGMMNEYMILSTGMAILYKLES